MEIKFFECVGQESTLKFLLEMNQTKTSCKLYIHISEVTTLNMRGLRETCPQCNSFSEIVMFWLHLLE